MADMLTEISLGLQSCIQVGRLKDEGKRFFELVSVMNSDNINIFSIHQLGSKSFYP
jgi:glutaryl-CoA dehydrogenase